jgi:hypothetical protein
MTASISHICCLKMADREETSSALSLPALSRLIPGLIPPKSLVLLCGSVGMTVIDED